METSPQQLRVRRYWGDVLFDTALFPESGEIKVGQSRRANFIAEVKPYFDGSTWRLARLQKNSAEISFHRDQSGYLKTGDTITPLRQLIESNRALEVAPDQFVVTLLAGEECDVALGQVTFHLDWVTPGEALTRRTGMATVEKSLAFSFFLLFAGLFSVFFFLPSSPPVLPESTERTVMIIPPERPVELAKPEPQPQTEPEPEVVPAAPAEPTQKAVAQAAPVAPATRKSNPAKAPPAVAPLPQEESLSDLSESLTAVGQKGTMAPALPRKNREEGTVGLPQKLSAVNAEAKLDKVEGGGRGKFVDGEARSIIAGERQLAEGATKTGGLSRELAEQLLSERRNNFRSCYEKQLLTEPQLKGRLLVRFNVLPSGSVAGAKILTDEMRSVALNTCVLSELKRIPFPANPQRKTTQFDYPFDFKPLN